MEDQTPEKPLDSSNAQQVLHERAVQYAKADGEETLDLGSPYIQFRLGNVERYGIPYEHIKEILETHNITRVPCTPAHIAGLANHRSELLPVIDLKTFFNITDTDNKQKTQWVIVIQHNNKIFGILANHIYGSEYYQADKLTAALASENVRKMEYIKGIYSGNITMLDAEAILNDPDINVNETTK